MKKGIFVSFRLRDFLSLSLVFVLTFSIMISFGFASTTTLSNLKTSENTIIVDAGHGGEDGGTQSSAGVLEKDINLDISMKLGTLLSLSGYNVVYTRTEDKLYYGADAKVQRQKKVSDIHYRMSILQTHPDALFISIHQNYFQQSKYSGAQVFYSENNPDSKIVAENIQSNIRNLIQPENERQIKASSTDIYLLYHAKLPAVMVECGFMSNAGEALLLCDEEYQKNICLAIMAGIS